MRRYRFYFSLAVLGSIGDKFGFTNLRIIALNPSLTMFSSKINVRDLLLKEVSFVYEVSMPGKHEKSAWCPLLFTGLSKDYERVGGRFVMKNNKI